MTEMMTQNLKPYSKILNDQNDRISKETAIDFLQNFKGWLLDVPLDCQPELFKDSDFKMKVEVKIEVERKRTWIKSGTWQGYKTLDVPYRKKDNNADVFIMLNEHCDTLAYIKMKDIKHSPISNKSTINFFSKEKTSNESFFNVNLKNCIFYTKKNNKWVLLEKI